MRGVLSCISLALSFKGEMRSTNLEEKEKRYRISIVTPLMLKAMFTLLEEDKGTLGFESWHQQTVLLGTRLLLLRFEHRSGRHKVSWGMQKGTANRITKYLIYTMSHWKICITWVSVEGYLFSKCLDTFVVLSRIDVFQWMWIKCHGFSICMCFGFEGLSRY